MDDLVKYTTLKCPKKQLKACRKLFVKKGAPKTCKFKKMGYASLLPIPAGGVCMVGKDRDNVGRIRRKNRHSALFPLSCGMLQERFSIMLRKRSNTFGEFSSTVKETSGCHCTPRIGSDPSAVNASTKPSAAMALAFRPGARSSTAW